MREIEMQRGRLCASERRFAVPSVSELQSLRRQPQITSDQDAQAAPPRDVMIANRPRPALGGPRPFIFRKQFRQRRKFFRRLMQHECPDMNLGGVEQQFAGWQGPGDFRY